MPPAQFEVLDARRYRLRHVRPAGSGDTVYATVLGRTYTAKDLPTSHLPASPDFVTGTWTGRLGDSGEFQIDFPNKEASDGFPWRSRFSTLGHLEFIEVYRDDDLEFVGCIFKQDGDRTSWHINGWDGWSLLKKAYEADYQCVMAPRDVIERYTSVPVCLVADTFPGASVDAAKWTVTTLNSGTATVNNNALTLTAPSGATNPQAFITSVGTLPVSGAWRLTATVTVVNVVGAGNFNFTLSAGFGGAQASISLATDFDKLFTSAPGTTTIRRPATYKKGGRRVLTLESDGRWVRAYIDGVLTGYAPAPVFGSPPFVQVAVQADGGGTGGTAIVTLAVARYLAPFLMRGADKGDYVLPGAASTYPTGGLHGRYFNDLDLQGDAGRIREVLSPSRTPYSDRLDATVNAQANPQPGAGAANWSARWFGAIYLKLSAGLGPILTVQWAAGVNGAARLWVGKTAFGDQIIDQMALFQAGLQTFNATITPATFGSKDGWYPIILEFANDTGSAQQAAKLLFDPRTSYTDPGGTALVSGSVVVPATSLSALGCVDQRFQGQSHFDIVQKTAQAAGHQLSAEPAQLESGSFPAVLAPRLREGRDVDVILEPDETDRRERIMNYGTSIDSTDQASSMRGNGAGLQDGSSGQLQAEVVDAPSLTAGLFDLEAWTDASDISQATLLQARLNSELGLRLSAWQTVTGDPLGQNRLADTFPLTGQLAAMKWRPGDGVRLLLRDVNVQDISPRQIMMVTRTFGPEGRTGCQAQFRSRPKDDAYWQREMTYRASRPQRTYQRQYVALTSNYVLDTIAAAGFGNFCILQLQAQDVVVKAVARVTTNVFLQPLDIAINNTLRGASLGGTWVGVPLEIDVTPYATQATTTDNRFFAQLKNTGGVNTQADLQLIVTVMR